MSDLFFFGALRHAPLLRCVLGRALSDVQITDVTLEGFDARSIMKSPNATLLAQEGARAGGVLMKDASEEDFARLRFYCAGSGLHEIQLKLGETTALGFVKEAQAGEAYDFDQWRQKWADVEVLAAQEAMSYFGEISTKDLAFRMMMIRVRAAAKINAQRENHAFSPSGYTRSDVLDHGAKRKFTGFFSYAEQNLSFKQYDGSMSDPVGREVFLASDATIVLPYDPVRDRVMLVEQFRPGPYARNDQTPWMLEPIAGRIDPGETPESTAYREAEEEAGLTLDALHEVAKCYSSPGCSNEYFNIFVGLADLPDDCVGTHGLDSEAEDIRSYLFSFDQLMDMVDTHQTANAPLVLAALWLARKRDSLRKLS